MGMKTSLLLLISALATQNSFAGECKNRERFYGPNVAFGITFWYLAPEGNESVENCKKSAQSKLGSFVDCDSTADFPAGCTVFAVDYKFIGDDGIVTTGRVRQ